MKEQKIMTFSQKDYRLNLLKITETNVNGYFLIREKRRIKGTFTTLDAAVKKFYALQGSKILQKEIFNEVEEENITDIKTFFRRIEIYPCSDGYRLFGEYKHPQEFNAKECAKKLGIKPREDNEDYFKYTN